MTDSGSTPWTSPGDGAGAGEAPPPPPPPEAMGAWTPVERVDPAPHAGGGWQPPPRPRWGGGPLLIAIAGVVLLVIGLGAIGLVAVRSDVTPDVGETDVATEPGRLDSARDQELAAVLTTIDAAERRMIAFQNDAFLALQSDPEGFGDTVRAEAEDAARDLTELREDLVLHARDSSEELQGVQVIRDTYRVHLEAWIAYTEAVAGDPVLVRPDNPDAEPYWEDIATTAEEFVQGVDAGMPSDAPQELQDRADFILDRGFRDDGAGELV